MSNANVNFHNVTDIKVREVRDLGGGAFTAAFTAIDKVGATLEVTLFSKDKALLERLIVADQQHVIDRFGREWIVELDASANYECEQINSMGVKCKGEAGWKCYTSSPGEIEDEHGIRQPQWLCQRHFDLYIGQPLARAELSTDHFGRAWLPEADYKRHTCETQDGGRDSRCNGRGETTCYAHGGRVPGEPRWLCYACFDRYIRNNR